MNEFLRKFIMDTIRKMIASDVDEWQVRQYALGWFEKSVLTQDDLMEIETLYAEKEAQRLAEEEVKVEEKIVEVPAEGE